MKKWIALLLAAVLCFSLAACGGDVQADNPDQPQNNEEQNDAPDAAAPIISDEELCGVYVSSLDEQFAYTFTLEEHTRNENNQILTSPVYFGRRGEESAKPVGIFSWEIEGDVLTLTSWNGETIPYQIVKDNGTIQLKFLKEQYSFSSFDVPQPENQAFLSDLIKETTEQN